MTVRKSIAALSVLAAALFQIAPAGAQDNVVNVFNWSDYIDEEILAEFTGYGMSADAYHMTLPRPGALLVTMDRSGR